MTNLSKLNHMVTEVFGDVADVSDLWTSNSAVQKKLRSLLSTGVKKDPNAPRRAKSAYIFFCADNRAQVSASLGEDAVATDVTRELGVRWNALKASKKASDKQLLAKYEQLALQDKERYTTEKSSYVPPEPSEEAPKRRGGKKPVVPGQPKRARNAYIFFCGDVRAQLKESEPELKSSEITARQGVMWNELKVDPSRRNEMERYLKLAEEDKARYEAEKAAFESGGSVPTSSVAPAAKAPAAKKAARKAPVKAVASKPAPKAKAVEAETVRKTNPYQAFLKERRPQLKEENPDMEGKEISKLLTTEWKGMSQEEKDKWR
jgi:hypothetical protein